MSKEILYVILPCYNEQENIENLIRKWENEENKLSKHNILLKLVIVNDGSSDDTLKIVKKLKNSYGNVQILNHKVNKGLGEALNTGINYVINKKEMGLVCIMDSDLTHQPHYIHSMIKKVKSENIECVIASRYREGSKVEGLSFIRKFLSFGARIVYSITLKIPNVRDYTCGYRVYNITILKILSKKYKGKIISEKSFACMMEFVYKIDLEGFEIGEVPFVLKYQLKKGKSKMQIFKTICRSLIMLSKLRRIKA